MPIIQEIGPPATAVAGESERQALPSALRGAAQCCPACGRGKLFTSYLKVAHACDACGEALHHQRADDAPAYFTMAIVAHIVVGGLLAVEQTFAPPTWVQLSIWLPMTLVLSLALLPVVKGALVGLQWGLRMHGFGTGRDPAEPAPDPAAAVIAAGEGRKA
ncbi:MAG: DUF983 domain-containing protein [Hyphomicrobiaceae bacterium]